MTEIYTGGSIQGLNLREYFAAMAMNGYLAGTDRVIDPCGLAIIAVEYADALIAELAEGNADA